MVYEVSDGEEQLLFSLCSPSAPQTLTISDASIPMRSFWFEYEPPESPDPPLKERSSSARYTDLAVSDEP